MVGATSTLVGGNDRFVESVAESVLYCAPILIKGQTVNQLKIDIVVDVEKYLDFFKYGLSKVKIV